MTKLLKINKELKICKADKSNVTVNKQDYINKTIEFLQDPNAYKKHDPLFDLKK